MSQTAKTTGGLADENAALEASIATVEARLRAMAGGLAPGDAAATAALPAQDRRALTDAQLRAAVAALGRDAVRLFEAARQAGG